MHPQELEAEVPMRAGERVSGPSESERNTNNPSLSPIHEKNTPMAELAVQERGLGYGVSRQEGNDNHVVSPASTTIPEDSMMGRASGAGGSEGSPTISDATWTPTTPVQRTGTVKSRFEERLDD